MRILFFAQLKDATGSESVEMDVPSPVGEERLWATLLEQFPALAAYRASTRLARNGEYAAARTEFSGKDEIALIPPVSGG